MQVQQSDTKFTVLTRSQIYLMYFSYNNLQAVSKQMVVNGAKDLLFISRADIGESHSHLITNDNYQFLSFVHELQVPVRSEAVVWLSVLFRLRVRGVFIQYIQPTREYFFNIQHSGADWKKNPKIQKKKKQEKSRQRNNVFYTGWI